MEIVFQIIEHLPSGWPRIAVLAALGTLFFLPEMRRKVTWHLSDKERFDRARQLLELRQLEIEVKELQAQHPESKNELLDMEIKALLHEVPKESLAPERIAWPDRFRYAMSGSFSLMVLGTLALWQSGKFVDKSALHVISVELGYAVASGLLASAIPSRHAWECVFRGFLIPAILGAMVAAVIGNN